MTVLDLQKRSFFSEVNYFVKLEPMIIWETHTIAYMMRLSGKIEH